MHHPIAKHLSFLKSQGFAVAPVRECRKMSFEEVQNNLYGRLDNFALLGFRFIRYPDQAITVSAQGQVFECFGRCEFGALATDGYGCVLLLVSDRENFEGRTTVFTNTTLAQFVQCYCWFVAAIYRLKGNLQGDWDALESEAADLAAQIRQSDPDAVCGDSFWTHLVYLIEDNYFYSHLPLSQYMADGRWQGT